MTYPEGPIAKLAAMCSCPGIGTAQIDYTTPCPCYCPDCQDNTLCLWQKRLPDYIPAASAVRPVQQDCTGYCTIYEPCGYHGSPEYLAVAIQHVGPRCGRCWGRLSDTTPHTCRA